MTTLDSTFEVLAFDYVRFVINNLWTWIAVVTAAVSFWRIRATTTTTSGGRDGLIDKSPLEPPKVPKPQAKKATLVVETGLPRVTVMEEDWSPLLCNDGVTKGKLTVFYREDIDGERAADDYGEITAVKYGGGESGEWWERWERWERVVKMRNGDEGWYRYVDLTVINGNVVRLWDANGVRNGGLISVQHKECYV